MKKILVLLFLFVSNYSIAQKSLLSKFIGGPKWNKNKKELFTDSIQLKKTLNRLDSLCGIEEQKLIDSISGKWRLKRSGSNWRMDNENDSLTDQILIINSTHFLFYEQNVKTKEMKLIASEKVNFLRNMFGKCCTREIVFSDSLIWSFSLNKVNGELEQYNTGNRIETGRTYMVCGNLERYYIRFEDCRNTKNSD